MDEEAKQMVEKTDELIRQSKALREKNQTSIKIEQVFYEWKDNMWIGMTPEDQKEMLEQIIGCLDE